MISLRPYITEKSVNLAKQGFFTICVDRNTAKGQIKKELQNIFKVKVKKIRIICGKSTKLRKSKGKIATNRGIKKAIVVLSKNESIPGFDIAESGKKDNKKQEAENKK